LLGRQLNRCRVVFGHSQNNVSCLLILCTFALYCSMVSS
jgi:ribosomal protein S27E